MPSGRRRIQSESGKKSPPAKFGRGSPRTGEYPLRNLYRTPPIDGRGRTEPGTSVPATGNTHQDPRRRRRAPPTRSSHAIVDPRVWNRASNLAGWNAYLSGKAGEDIVPPYAAPARATELSGLPPAYINVGTLDLFVDEDIAYAQALLAANVPTELRVYPGAFHGSPSMAPDAEISRRWRRDELSALDRALNGAR